MPEGDVVWRTANRLQAALAGRQLTTWDLRWPSLATTDLRGHLVSEVVSVGKHLLIRLIPESGLDPTTDDLTEARHWTLHSHLRMEGSWRIQRATLKIPANPGVRAVIGNDQWTAVGLRLGMLDLVPTAKESDLVGHLGPDVLGLTWSAEQAAANLREKPERAIGEALLDQRVLAGVGTYFMCEALFLRGRSPWTPVAEFGAHDLDALIDLIHRLLSAHRNRGIQSTTGDLRSGRTAYVHARSGLECRRCGTTIRVASIGQAPQDRVAFYCPQCQPGPTPTDPQDRAIRPLGSGRRAARPRPITPR